MHTRVYIPLISEACSSNAVAYEYKYSSINREKRLYCLDFFFGSIIYTGFFVYKNNNVQIGPKTEDIFFSRLFDALSKNTGISITNDSSKRLYDSLTDYCEKLNENMLIIDGIYSSGDFDYCQQYQAIVHDFLTDIGVEGNEIPLKIQFKNLIKGMKKEADYLKRESIRLFITKNPYMEEEDDFIGSNIHFLSQDSSMQYSKNNLVLQSLNGAYERLLFEYALKAVDCCIQNESINYYWDYYAQFLADEKIAILHLVDRKERYFFLRHNMSQNQQSEYYSFSNNSDSFINSFRDRTTLSDETFVEKNPNGMFSVLPSSGDVVFANLYNIFSKGDEKAYVVLVNDSTFYDYTNDELSTWTKIYLDNVLHKTISMVNPNYNKPEDFLLYNAFLYKYCDQAIADNFLFAHRSVKNNDYQKFSNVGNVIAEFSSQIIKDYAVASDHYVKTMYRVIDDEDYYIEDDIEIETIDNDGIVHKHLIPKSDGEKYAYSWFDDYETFDKPEYIELFKAISETATNNLEFLDDEAIVQALSTSEWLYSNVGAIQGLDNTFICAGYFKLMEILLKKIIINCYPKEATESIYSSRGTPLDLENQEESDKILMLKRMIFFLKDRIDDSHRCYEWKKMIMDSLESWLVTTRNGYFHKDILSSDEVLDIRCRTMEVIYIVLGVFVR